MRVGQIIAINIAQFAFKDLKKFGSRVLWFRSAYTSATFPYVMHLWAWHVTQYAFLRYCNYIEDSNTSFDKMKTISVFLSGNRLESLDLSKDFEKIARKLNQASSYTLMYQHVWLNRNPIGKDLSRLIIIWWNAKILPDYIKPKIFA